MEREIGNPRTVTDSNLLRQEIPHVALPGPGGVGGGGGGRQELRWRQALVDNIPFGVIVKTPQRSKNCRGWVRRCILCIVDLFASS